LTGKSKSTQPTPAEEDALEQGGKRSLVRSPLSTLSGLTAEVARVYRAMRDNKLDHGKGRSLVWVRRAGLRLQLARWMRVASTRQPRPTIQSRKRWTTQSLRARSSEWLPRPAEWIARSEQGSDALRVGLCWRAS
jgi:hypothetical protein